MDKLSRKNSDEINTINQDQYTNERGYTNIHLKQKINGFLSRFVSTLGTVGTITAIAVSTVGMIQHLAEQPNISMSVEQIKFGLNELELISELRTIEDSLNGIEDEYYEYTGNIINKSLEKIEGIKEKLQISSQQDTYTIISPKEILEELIKNTDEQIKKINNEIESLKQQINKVQDSEKIEELQLIIEELKEGKNILEEGVKPKINELVKKFQNDAEAKKKSKKVIVELLVENHSRIKNGLYKTGVITFYKDKNTYLPILLNIKENISIESNSFERIKLESKKFNPSQERDYKFIRSAF